MGMFNFSVIRVLLVTILLAYAVSSFADNELKSPLVEPGDKVHQPSDTLSFDMSADFRSRHIWRGSLTCNTWNVQPTMNLSKKNILVGVWGAYTVDNSYTEFDLYFSYTMGNFTLALLDYFCPNPADKFSNLFNFNRNSTKHTLDATLSFNGTKKIPVSIMASILFFGDDVNTATGKNYYSTYIETAYHWKPNPKMDVDFHMGFTPFEGYYASQPYVVSCGASVTQRISVTPTFTIPVSGKLIVNPYTESVYLVFGFTLGV